MDISSSIFLESNAGDIIVSFLVLIFLVFFYRLHQFKDRRFNMVMALFIVERLVMTIVYYTYSLHYNADATVYYEVGRVYSSDLGYTGSATIFMLVYWLTYLFDLKYFALYWFFSLWGLMGVYWLYKICISINNGKWSRWFWLFLLPNMHFWSVAIGKDSIAFTGVVAIIYLAYFRKGLLKVFFPLLLLFLSRPHIFLFGLTAYFLVLILHTTGINAIRKIVLIGVLAGIMVLSAPYFSTFISVDEGQSYADRLVEMSEEHARGFTGQGSDIDLRGQNIFVKWGSFLFRPFLFEAHNITAAIASIENLIWVYLFVFVVRNFKNSLSNIHDFKQLKGILWFAFYGFWVSSLLLAYIIHNSGLAQREKNNLFPYFLILVFITISGNYFSFLKKKRTRNNILKTPPSLY